MPDRIACKACGTAIQATTAVSTGGYCRPCAGGYRESIEREKQRRAEERTDPPRDPTEHIETCARFFATMSDNEFLRRLEEFEPLADEDDPLWKDADYWKLAYEFVALVDSSAQRRLVPAIRMLLDRACYGDPGEMIRGLRHALEYIAKPDWNLLADICLEAAVSDRAGTRLWAMNELTVLKEPRAEWIFRAALKDERSRIRAEGAHGLRQLGLHPGP